MAVPPCIKLAIFVLPCSGNGGQLSLVHSFAQEVKKLDWASLRPRHLLPQKRSQSLELTETEATTSKDEPSKTEGRQGDGSPASSDPAGGSGRTRGRGRRPQLSSDRRRP